MRIYSAPSFAGISGETFYSINLPQIGKMFWQAPSTLAEAPYLATSTTAAGVYRQLTKYDDSAIKKQYQVVLTDAEAVTVQAMDNSEQTEWYVDTGAGVYNCIVQFALAYVSGRATCTISISVLEKIS